MFCKYCGKKVDNDAVFCPYCGKRIENVEEKHNEDESIEIKTNISIPKHDYNKPKKFKPKVDRGTRIIDFVIVFLLLVTIIGSIGFFSDSENDNETDSTASSITNASSNDNDMEPLALPANGQILTRADNDQYVLNESTVRRKSELTINCKSGSNCYVKLKKPDGETIISFFVRSGQTCKVDVPARRLQVFFAYGNDWYGVDKAFGKKTTYAKDDEILDFSTYTYTYTLYPVSDGNFTETPISSDEF